MARSVDGAAVNVALEPVATYAPDPRGWGMAAGLQSVLQRGLNGQDGIPVIRRWNQWSGWCQPVQQFRGAANVAAGRPVVPANSDLSKETSAQITDPALRIFQARLARQQQ